MSTLFKACLTHNSNFHQVEKGTVQWRHNEHDGVSNHQPHDCLLNRFFRRRSKKISKLCFTGLCVGNSPVTDELPAQMASNAENVFIWWRHHVQPNHGSWAHYTKRLWAVIPTLLWRLLLLRETVCTYHVRMLWNTENEDLVISLL